MIVEAAIEDHRSRSGDAFGLLGVMSSSVLQRNLYYGMNSSLSGLFVLLKLVSERLPRESMMSCEFWILISSLTTPV